METKSKKFLSCFVTGVEIDEKKIVLEETGKKQFYIFRDNASAETLSSFKLWFENVYLRGVAQQCTIIDYTIGENADGEAVYVVNRILSCVEKKAI